MASSMYEQKVNITYHTTAEPRPGKVCLLYGSFIVPRCLSIYFSINGVKKIIIRFVSRGSTVVCFNVSIRELRFMYAICY